MKAPAAVRRADLERPPAMFTGIITALGRIESTQPLPGEGAGLRVRVATPPGWLGDAGLGDSICVSGACMTVVELGAEHFVFEVSAESLLRTCGLDQPGALLNLEQSLTLSTRLGGHLVTGHVDAVGRVQSFEPAGESRHLVLAAPAELARFFAYKGSVVVNGVSLTVNRVDDMPDGSARLHINLIAHTLQHTNLHELREGGRGNLEVDLIARYVQRMLASPEAQD